MVSLGCSKNQVDAERMLHTLKQAGFTISPDPSRCDVVIINTCGFIEDAKRESIDAIFEFAGQKGSSGLKGIVVTGCLPERYRQQFVEELPEVDVVLGIGKNTDIVEAVNAARSGKTMARFGEKTDLPLEGERILANAPYFAYLKVAEGCDNRCSYCAIPDIRGPFRSRAMESILAEAEQLAAQGVRELNVVAQDTTRYGEDLYGRLMLPRLLEELCRIEGLHWVRVLYCYPDRITDELLAVMAKQEKIVKYMDIPIQHVSGRVLQAMNRRGDSRSLEALMAKIRREVPGITLRTTLITGFPGEREADFAELCAFVEKVRFQRLGCFAYSWEEGTPAAEMDGQIDDEVKRRRADIVMELQAGIAEETAAAMAGSTLEVLTEGFDGELGLFYGRGAADAPDIDTKVTFSAIQKPVPGEFVTVTITGSRDYDLIGERDEPSQ